MDYKKIGLRVGLELHQQICKSKKLFCNCPATLRKDKPDFTIKRELRPMAGETGVIDTASLYEKTRDLYYIYEGYNDTVCEIECDESPPREINNEALTTALIITKMFNSDVPEFIQIMRKTITNGSVCSAFQRTALVGLNGFINTKEGKIRIESICLEEDAARRTTETKKSVTYRLDRQGIALIEIATAPEIYSPQQTKEVAKYIHTILKATGKTISGIGTIRQDINVSIKGHPRVELKGVQDLRSIPKIVKKEVERQLSAIKSRKKLESHVRNVLPDNSSKFLRPMPGAARMYVETDHPIIHITKNKLNNLQLPETHEDKLRRLNKLNISKNLAKQLANHHKVNLFEEIVDSCQATSGSVIGDTLLSIESRVKKETGKKVKFSDEVYRKVFSLLDKGKIVKESLFNIFVGIAKGEKLQNLVKRFETLSEKELKKEIDKLLKKHKNAPENKITGIIIGQLRGKADPRKIIEILKKK